MSDTTEREALPKGCTQVTLPAPHYRALNWLTGFAEHNRREQERFAEVRLRIREKFQNVLTIFALDAAQGNLRTLRNPAAQAELQKVDPDLNVTYGKLLTESLWDLRHGTYVLTTDREIGEPAAPHNPFLQGGLQRVELDSKDPRRGVRKLDTSFVGLIFNTRHAATTTLMSKEQVYEDKGQMFWELSLGLIKARRAQKLYGENPELVTQQQFDQAIDWLKYGVY